MKKVERGLREGKESNKVHFAPSLVTVQQMEAVLKQAGTYLGTAN